MGEEGKSVIFKYRRQINVVAETSNPPRICPRSSPVKYTLCSRGISGYTAKNMVFNGNSDVSHAHILILPLDV